MTVILVGVKRVTFTGSDGKEIEGSNFFLAREIPSCKEGELGYQPLRKPIFLSKKRACSLFTADPVLFGIYTLSFDDRGRVESLTLAN